MTKPLIWLSTTYLEDLVAHADAAGLEGRPLGVDAAHEHRHAVAVLVSRQADAQTLVALLQLHHHHARSQVTILLFHFIWNKKRTALAYCIDNSITSNTCKTRSIF